MSNKKQILTAIVTVLISVGLVATAVYAVTTVGNDVAVGGVLTVAGNVTLGDNTVNDQLTVNASTTFATSTIFTGAMKLFQADDCSGHTGEGQLCWDADDDYLYIGDSSTAQVMASSTNIASDNTWTGVNTFTGNVVVGNADTDYLNVAASTTFATTTVFTGLVTFSGNLTVNGGTIILGNAGSDSLVINASTTFGSGGTPISKHISGTTSINVQSVAQATCVSTSTTAITGVAVGDTVIATPEPVANGVESTTTSWSVYASTTNEIALRICNVSTSTAVDLATQTWRFDVWKH